MAGHIAGLGYSQRTDANGRPLNGWRLYIYDTGTSTPVTSYQDYALSIEHPHPIEADSSGVMPMFWVADGTYRVRATDADGNELFDDDGVVALGPSSGTGGGSSSSVNSEALFRTGDLLWVPISGTRSGWVRCNARTIGSAASGGSERAAADCEELFLYLWTNFDNSGCPVSGGRGGSAAADWSANKTIGLIDMRFRGAMGLLGMGNTDLSITGGSSVAGTALGAAGVTITQANLPNVNLSSTALTATPQSTFDLTVTRVVNGGITVLTSLSVTRPSNNELGGAGDYVNDVSAGSTALSLSLASSVVSGTITSTVNLGGTIPLGGSGDSLNVTPRSRAGTWYIKL